MVELKGALGQARHIAIEGPIGVGKTSLARLIAEQINGQLLPEMPEANPFLARFYQDRQRYALQTQLFFLFQRLDQLREIAQPDLFRRPVVADWLLDKDPLFARLTLNDDEYALYQQIHTSIAPQAPRPDLVIYLQANPDTLIQRIRRRGIDMERRIDDDYLRRLADAYSRFFYHYNAAPVMIVNSENLNFVDRDADFRLLLDRLAAMRGGREYFNRGE